MMKPRNDYPLDRSEMAEPTVPDIYAEMTALLDLKAALGSPMPELPETMGEQIDMDEVGAFLCSMREASASAEHASLALGEVARGMDRERFAMIGVNGTAYDKLSRAVSTSRAAGMSSGMDEVYELLRNFQAAGEPVTIGIPDPMDDVFRRLIDVAESEPGREIRRAAENMREHIDARAPTDDGLTSRQARRAARRREGTTRWGRR